MSTPARKYVPQPEGLNLEFFRHAADGTLHLQQCDECDRFRHPPRYYCPQCGSPRYSYVPSTGRGTVYSWVTTHFTVDQGWVPDVPYTTVVVELDEGPRLVGALRGADAVRLGLPVVLVGEAKGEDFVFFWVEPRPAEASAFSESAARD